MQNRKLPELLAPAGSMEAVRAAVQNGAGAVYLGFGTFNARRGAKNFSPEQMREAIAYCRLRGVKTNITVNTLVSDREIPALLRDVRLLLDAGADALHSGDVSGCRAACIDPADHSFAGRRAAGKRAGIFPRGAVARAAVGRNSAHHAGIRRGNRGVCARCAVHVLFRTV